MKYIKLIILFLGITFISFSCDSDSVIDDEEITETEDKNDPSLKEDENTTYTWEHYVGFWDLIDLTYSTPSIEGDLETSNFQIKITSTEDGFLTFSDEEGEFTIEGQTEPFISLPELQGHPRIIATGKGVSNLTKNGTDPDNIKIMDVVRMTENYFKLRYREQAGVENIYLFKRNTEKEVEETGEQDNVWFDRDNDIHDLSFEIDTNACLDCSTATVTNPDSEDTEADNVLKWNIPSSSGDGNKALGFTFNTGKGITNANYANLKVTVRMYWESFADISNYDSTGRLRLILSDGTTSQNTQIKFDEANESGWHTVEFNIADPTLTADVISGEIRLIGNKFTNIDNGLDFYIDTVTANVAIEDVENNSEEEEEETGEQAIFWFDTNDSSVDDLTFSIDDNVCTDCSTATVTNPDSEDKNATNVLLLNIPSTSGDGNKSIYLNFNTGKGIKNANYTNLKVTVRMYWESFADISNYDSNGRFRLILSDGTNSPYVQADFVEENEGNWHTVEFDFANAKGQALENDVISAELRLIGNKFTNIDNGLDFYIDTITTNLEVEDVE